MGGRGFGQSPRSGHRGAVEIRARYDYVAGDFMWTGIDYLGEARGASHGSQPPVYR